MRKNTTWQQRQRLELARNPKGFQLPPKVRKVQGRTPLWISEGAWPADFLILDFKSPELLFWCFKQCSLWFFVTTALGHWYTAPPGRLPGVSCTQAQRVRAPNVPERAPHDLPQHIDHLSQRAFWTQIGFHNQSLLTGCQHYLFHLLPWPIDNLSTAKKQFQEEATIHSKSMSLI